MSSRTIRYAPRAQRDIRFIQAYSSKTWGSAQARKYVRELRTAVASVSTHPELGRPLDAVQSDIRRIRAGKHVIYYRVDQGSIEVVRVLHERRDISALEGAHNEQ